MSSDENKKRINYSAGNLSVNSVWGDRKTPRTSDNSFVLELKYGDLLNLFFWKKERERERCIYWIWAKISSSINSSEFLTGNEKLPQEEREKLSSKYKTIFYNAGKINNKEEAIQDFLKALSLVDNGSLVHSVIDSLEEIWQNQIRVVKKIKWLSGRSHNELEWTFRYLDKKNHIPVFYKNASDYYEPKELYQAIIGAIDVYAEFNSEKDISNKSILIDGMKKAFQKNKRAKCLDKNNGKVVLSAEISLCAKEALNEMAKLKGIPKNKFLDELLLREYKKPQP